MLISSVYAPQLICIFIFSYTKTVFLMIISSTEPKAHRRAYSVPMVRRPSVRRAQCLNISSEIAWPIKAKFIVEPPWVGGTKLCSRHVGLMTKMPPIPYMVKTLQKSSSPEPVDRFPRNLVCSIGDASPS